MANDPLNPADAVAGVFPVDAVRIGFLGDDHSAREDGADLPDEVLAAFESVDLIVHLGHMGYRGQLARGVLDRLETVAPVLAVRDYSTDPDGLVFITPAEGQRVAGLTRIIEAGGVRIGVVHNLDRPPGRLIDAPPGGLPDLRVPSLLDVLAEKFGGSVDVVASAATHRPAAIAAQGVLFVNPGSPTYPKGPGRITGERSLGTVGILHVAAGIASFEVIELALFGGSEAAAVFAKPATTPLAAGAVR